jgi:hypothetical protein
MRPPDPRGAAPPRCPSAAAPPALFDKKKREKNFQSMGGARGVGNSVCPRAALADGGQMLSYPRL